MKHFTWRDTGSWQPAETWVKSKHIARDDSMYMSACQLSLWNSYVDSELWQPCWMYTVRAQPLAEGQLQHTFLESYWWKVAFLHAAVNEQECWTTSDRHSWNIKLKQESKCVFPKYFMVNAVKLAVATGWPSVSGVSQPRREKPQRLQTTPSGQQCLLLHSFITAATTQTSSSHPQQSHFIFSP